MDLIKRIVIGAYFQWFIVLSINFINIKIDENVKAIRLLRSKAIMRFRSFQSLHFNCSTKLRKFFISVKRVPN